MTVKNFEEIAAFGKANVDAFVKSGTVVVEGAKTLTNAYVALANQSVAQAQAAVKSLTAVKTPVEFQTVVTSLTKANFEAAQAEGAKLQGLVKTVVTDSLAPLTARIEAVSSLFKAA